MYLLNMQRIIKYLCLKLQHFICLKIKKSFVVFSRPHKTLTDEIKIKTLLIPFMSVESFTLQSMHHHKALHLRFLVEGKSVTDDYIVGFTNPQKKSVTTNSKSHSLQQKLIMCLLQMAVETDFICLVLFSAFQNSKFSSVFVKTLVTICV